MPNPVIDRDTIIEKVAILVHDLIIRRLNKLRGDNISAFLNVNPFLLSCLRDFHSFSTVHSIADFLFIAHMAQGHSTAFGKLIDEKILPQAFNTVKLDAAERQRRRLTAAAYNEIDHIVNPNSDDEWCLLSLKASAWTIQDTAAHNLYNAFKQIGDFQVYGKEIIVGVFYGKEDDLTNKYDILRGINPRQQDQFVELGHVRVLTGKQFWSWLNGGEDDTQLWVLEGTRIGSASVFSKLDDADILNAPEKLANELAKKYGLEIDHPINWEQLLLAING